MRSAADRATTFDRIIAIARRDLAVELSYHFALLARFLGIVGTVATFFFIGRIVDPRRLSDYGGNYFEFVLVGLLVGSIAAVGLGSFTETIRTEQSSGTLEVLLTLPTSLRVLFAGSLIIPFGLASLETSIVFAAVVALGAHFEMSGALTAALAIPPTLVIYASFGAVSAAFIVLSKRGDPVTPIVAQLTNFLAGALFPIAVLPEVLQVVARLLPPYYALEVLRAGLLRGESIFDVWTDYAILVGFAVVMLPLSLAVLTRALRIARVTGTLGSY